MGRPMRGTNLAELLDPVLDENARRFGTFEERGFDADAVASEEILRVLPPELSSEVRLGRGGKVGGETLVVVATKSVVEICAADAVRLSDLSGCRGRGTFVSTSSSSQLVDAIEWLVVRLDGPVRENEDFEVEPGQSGEVVAVLGWAPANADVADNWIGELLSDLGLWVYDEDTFELRGNP